MTLSEMMAQEFNFESGNTRKCLERIPRANFDFKPHEKSFSMIQLATHLANLITWIETIVNNDHFDMQATFDPPPAPASTEELLALFDKNLKTFNDTLDGRSDAELFEKWQLKSGDEVIVEMPKVACIRSFILSHSIHHRGQLSVYLRENNIPVPSIYGPSADESM